MQQAQDAITQAQQQLALAQQPSTQQEIEAQRAVANQAQQQLEKTKQPFTTFDIQQQQYVVDQAAATLRSREKPYTDQDLQSAQAGVDQAQAALSQAQLGVQETEVVAPIDGVVFDRQASPGELVGPTSSIVTLIPPTVQVAINVDEAALGHVSQGQSVSIKVPAYPDQTFTGTVSTVAPGVDPKTRTATVLIQPQDEAGNLKPGMLAQVGIIIGSQSDALLVPTQAVLGTPAPNSQATVVTLDGDVAHHTTVQLGLVNPSVAQITSGLSDGQVVAVGNTGGLNNGDVVAPQMQTQTALAPIGVQE